MGIEENKKVLQRYFDEVLSKGNHAVMDELMHEDFNGRPGELKISGREAHIQYFDWARSLMPDMHIETDEMIAEGDKVVAWSTWYGTFTGADFYGQPATGNKINCPVVAVYGFKDGKMISGRVITDSHIVFTQMGVKRPPELD